MKITLIHPAIGRKPGERYLRTWQMEPLSPAILAGLTPPDVEVRFYDDRMEGIPFDAPTDLVAISVETYTAKRAYQIASEYRRRRVPVVMGGFHATLATNEVVRFAEAVVVGEAETLWPRVLDDARHGRLERIYRAESRPPLAGVRPDRRIFSGKRYLPVRLLEAGRGCRFRCDFCAIQSFFGSTHGFRPVGDVLGEIADLRDRGRVLFFVDDNFTSDISVAKEFLRALVPLRVRWVSQASIDAAHDEEFLDLAVRSGCKGLLIGFESLAPATLVSMRKGWNLSDGGYERALANLRRHRIRLYATFVFGYDTDAPRAFDDSVDFARRNAFYMVAFNHLTPFPGTDLYRRLETQGRLRYDAWWLDDRYRYNEVPFEPRKMSPEDIRRGCLSARRRFYSIPSIARRAFDEVNRSDLFMWGNYFWINVLLRSDVTLRDGYPLGDAAWPGPMIEAV